MCSKLIKKIKDFFCPEKYDKKLIDKLELMPRHWGVLPILDRYIMREFLTKFSILMLVFIFAFIMGEALDSLGDFMRSKDATIVVTIKYFLLMLPGNLRFILPLVMLLGTIWTLATFGKNQEVTAMRASGVSLLRCGSSILIFGIIVSCFNIYLNDSQFDNELTINVHKKCDNVLNYVFYLENEHFNIIKHKEERFTKLIKANTNEVIILYNLNGIPDYHMLIELKTKITDKELIEYILRNGLREQLDEEEMLIQYMIEYKNGYYVLIENKYEDEAFDMKLMLKGLEYEGNIRDVYFKLNEQEIKQFKLQVSENVNSGIVSFQFQFADM